MPIAACSDPALITVTKTIVANALTGLGGGQSVTLSDEDTVQFAIVVKNVGGETIEVDVADPFDDVFTGTVDVEDNPDGLPTWTRTDVDGVTTETGVGSIAETGITLAAGEQVSWLVEAIFSPSACTSLTTNVVTVTLPGDNCCHENEVYAWANVINADGPRIKLDATEGFTAMEALFHLFEGADFNSKVRLAKFVNECGTMADFINGEGGGAGDGVAVAILDAFGDPTGLYAETSPGS